MLVLTNQQGVSAHDHRQCKRVRDCQLLTTRSKACATVKVELILDITHDFQPFFNILISFSVVISTEHAYIAVMSYR